MRGLGRGARARGRFPVLAAVVALLTISPLSAAVPVGGPVAEFVDGAAWYVLAELFGPVSASGRGCATDGAIHAAAPIVATTLEVFGKATTSNTGDQSCLAVEATFESDAPGTHHGRVHAVDAAGREAVDGGSVAVEIIPFAPETVEGFPPLDPLPPGPGWMTLELYVADDGRVRAARVGDTTLRYDTITGYAPSAGDHHVYIDYDTSLRAAYVRIDNQDVWGGFVRQAGPHWWHIVPVEDPLPSLLASQRVSLPP